MKKTKRKTSVIKRILNPEHIEQQIFIIRNQRVMIDRDLAELYGVENKYLNRQVRRNRERFPEEFMFQLSEKERDEVVTICHHLKALKFSRVLPCAFTEHGIAMLASILKSQRAVKVSIYIVKVFVRMRKWLSTQKEFSRKLFDLEQRVNVHDVKIRKAFDALYDLLAFKSKPRKQIGFHAAR